MSELWKLHSNFMVRGAFPRVVRKACTQVRTCRKHRLGWVVSTLGNYVYLGGQAFTLHSSFDMTISVVLV